MKILFITSNASLYGANKSLLTLLRRFSEDCEVHCVLPERGDFSDHLQSLNIPHSIRAYSWSMRNVTPRWYEAPRTILRKVKQVWGLIRLIRTIDPDLIYTNTSVIDQGMLAAKALRKPHVWHIREFGDLDYGLHYDLGEKVFSYLKARSTFLVAISKAVRQHQLNHIPEEQCATIYNGVVSNEQIKSKPRSLESDPIRLGIVGLIDPIKGHMDAVNLLGKLKAHPVHLHVYGTGSPVFIDELNQVARQLDVLEKLHFEGFRKHVSDIYQGIDILLVCSRAEAMGRVVVEAMSFGVPVIGKNSGGIPELIQDSVNGFVYNEVPDLADTVTRLIGNRDLYATMSANCIEIAFQQYSTDRYVEQIRHLIEKILEK